MDKTSKQIEFLNKSFHEAYSYSKRAHDLLFKNYRDKNNESLSCLWLNYAISIISSCKSVYYSNYDELENLTVEKIFNKFFIFSREFLNNVTTGHSHQWTDIEFQAFKSALQELIEIDD